MSDVNLHTQPGPHEPCPRCGATEMWEAWDAKGVYIETVTVNEEGNLEYHGDGNIEGQRDGELWLECKSCGQRVDSLTSESMDERRSKGRSFWGDVRSAVHAKDFQEAMRRAVSLPRLEERVRAVHYVHTMRECEEGTTKIYTIGYEGRTLEDFIAALKGAGVKCLADVRDRAHSRKKGFSKTALRTALEGAGIAYRHFREVGNPKHIRKSGGSAAEIIAAYDEHMADRWDDVLGELFEQVQEQTTALMCFERDPAECHRTSVARELGERTGAEVVALVKEKN